MTSFSRSALVAASTLVFIGALQFVVASWDVKPAMVDFNVLYCGERTAFAHGDPYRTEPLRTCEHAVNRNASSDPAWLVTPFALPGYTIPFFAVFGLLPFAAASMLWLATLAGGFSVAAAAVARIAQMPTVFVAAVFAPTIGFLNFTLGEPVDISIACVALAALALERRQPHLAAIAAAFAMIEPHVGLPACLALFARVPRARLPLATAALIFLGLSIAALGPAVSLEYVRSFLPVHAHAELYAADQYSLSHLLFLAGVAPKTAIALGGIEYLVAIAIGIAAATGLTARGAPHALIVLLPVAIAMLGGSFIHAVEIAAALPAALVLARRSLLARIAVLLLAVPWGSGTRGLIVLVAAASLALAIVCFDGPTLRRGLYATVMAAAVVAANAVLPVKELSEQTSRALPPVAIAGDTPSSIAWEWGTRLKPAWSDDRPRSLAIKLPTWLALLLIAFAALHGSLETLRREPGGRPRPRVTTTESPLGSGP